MVGTVNIDKGMFTLKEYTDGDDGVVRNIIVDAYRGILFSRTEMAQLVKDFEHFYEGTSDEFISDYNDRKEREYHEEWVSRNEGVPDRVIQDTNKVIKSGFVYVLKEDFSGTYKIGRTKNIKNRAGLFAVKLPFDWRFVFIYRSNDMYSLEESLHIKFSDRRVNGEWFSLTEGDIHYLEKEIFDDYEISSEVVAE